MKAFIYKGKQECELQDHSYASPPVADRCCHQNTKYEYLWDRPAYTQGGDVPNMEPGLMLGHEGIGNVEALGSAVTNLFVDDSALISCITSCVVCDNVINGTQAEYVRILHASSSLHKLPTNIDAEAAVTFSDALPTGHECGSINANVQNGTKVPIIGAGPVGLSAMLTAKLYTPSLTVVINKVNSRLQHATRLGAEEVVNPASGDAMERLDALSAEHGFASVIKGVGCLETFELCQRIVAPGGSIANIGVHGERAQLALDRVWDRDIS